MIDLANRSDLSGGSSQEDLIRHVEVVAGNLGLGDIDRGLYNGIVVD